MAGADSWAETVCLTSAGTSSSEANRKATSLPFRQAGDLRPLRIGKAVVQSQPLFQADQTILHPERVEAGLKGGDHQGDVENSGPDRRESGMANGRDRADHKGSQQDRKHEEMKPGIVAGVIRKTLRCFFSHDGSSIGPSVLPDKV